ncbi:Ca2+:H+ antiporter [Fusarium proliferatum]|nr:Ca2+:H+ antiporter [Fusarium proliferatum]
MTLSFVSLVIPTTAGWMKLTQQPDYPLYAVVGQSGSKEKAQSMLTLSRGAAIIFLLLHFLYLNEDAEEPELGEPAIGLIATITVLCVTTVLVTVCADYLVDNIDELVETSRTSRGFIGLILILIVGNAAKHVTAVVFALRDKMDLAMGVAAGSSIQIALLVAPFLVIVGWINSSEITLHFETCKFVSVLVATCTIQDGKSNYLEGAMLIGLYIIIDLAFYVTPSDGMSPSK